MSTHNSHPAIIKRLKRASGHLASIVTMLEEDRPCVQIAQQLQAVESAISAAKKTLIHEHISECLTQTGDDAHQHAQDLAEQFRAIAKYL